LCDLYIGDAEAGRLLTRRKAAKKASTLATDRGRIERHIKPQLGRVAVAAVTREDAERFTYAVAEGETAVRIKTKKRGWRECAAAREPQAGRWGCSVRSSPMRCDTRCVAITRFMVSHGLPMAGANVACLKTSTLRWAPHCVKAR
jgi:hypothetical protein